MRFAFTKDQELLRDAVRDLLKRECQPKVVRQAWGAELPARSPLWDLLVAQGVTGMTVPEALGGLGLTETDLVLLLEECGRVALPEPVVETTAIAAPLLAELGEQRWLRAIAEGKVATVGLEPSPFAVSADRADVLIIARDGEIHAVPQKDAALTPEASVDGARRLFRVVFRPTHETRLAQGEQARAAVAAAFDRGATATSAVLVGLARQMLDMTVEYAKTRKQFGVAIGTFQAVKHHLASAFVAVEMARPAVYRAAYAIAQREPDRALHVSTAKALASDAALFTAKVALQCHGAIGYSFEHDLHLFMKRAWALAASHGDAAYHRARAGLDLVTRAQLMVEPCPTPRNG